jgi:tRNA G18 (ribose-2'-O)-methylase SpoU
VGRRPLLFGPEGAGLSAAALAAADERVRIRTTDRVDSLNVTVAASIAMHYCFA